MLADPGSCHHHLRSQQLGAGTTCDATWFPYCRLWSCRRVIRGFGVLDAQCFVYRCRCCIRCEPESIDHRKLTIDKAARITHLSELFQNVETAFARLLMPSETVVRYSVLRHAKVRMWPERRSEVQVPIFDFGISLSPLWNSKSRHSPENRPA